MNKMLLAIGLTVLATQSYASEQQSMDAKSKMSMMSDCSNHDKYANWQETKLTADVHQAFNRFKQNIDSDSPIKQVLQIRALNMDGRYFAFEVELKNGQVWHGNIHHNPRGDYLVDTIPHEGKLCP
ncbi:hypothetical protein [Vibrio panuliri]|uniref:Uncharacterized protein n=1 Tax=Vibrio panuliri TaxID=1381081 RepID=A0A1Q9HBB4_9VIBR|nr:hypothetical protein [Vibrio panuliri]KAB1457645.1 hypothetical protein F7O85_07860 [Vibrio panuliri]OLQ86435.1 hypothetical protein BIY22_12380 [Vibrio panuliri]OLQ87293.1 hypothetical protein BIY20_14200 [Vibrio panuliri]